MSNIHLFINILGQVIFGGYFVWNGIKHLKNSDSYTAYATNAGVPMPKVAVIVSGLMIFVGGLGVVFNVFMTFSLILTILFLIPVTFKMHQFWNMTNPQERASEIVTFGKNIALLGAALLMM